MMASRLSSHQPQCTSDQLEPQEVAYPSLVGYLSLATISISRLCISDGLSFESLTRFGRSFHLQPLILPE